MGKCFITRRGGEDVATGEVSITEYGKLSFLRKANAVAFCVKRTIQNSSMPMIVDLKDAGQISGSVICASAQVSASSVVVYPVDYGPSSTDTVTRGDGYYSGGSIIAVGDVWRYVTWD